MSVSATAQQQKRQLIDSPQVWHGSNLSESSNWIFELTNEMWRELKDATRLAANKGLEWVQINRQNFQIPETASYLGRIAEYLETGPGIAKLRGLDLASLTEADRRIMFYGIGQNLGSPVSMSRQGMMMSDVTDEGAQRAERYGHVKGEDNKDFLSSRGSFNGATPISQ